MRRDHGFQWQVDGFLNDYIYSRDMNRKIRGLPVVGKLEDSRLFLNKGYRFAFAIHPVGHGKLRKDALERMNIPLGAFVSVVHPLAFTAFDAEIGSGVILLPGCSIFSGAKIGHCTFLGSNVSIGHDVETGPFCHVSNGATISSYVRIGEGADVCLNATVLDMCSVGEFAVIGSGAVLTHNAEAGGVYVGNPAKKIKSVSEIPEYRLNPSESLHNL